MAAKPPPPHMAKHKSLAAAMKAVAPKVVPKPKGAPVKAGIAAGSLASDGPAVSLPSDPTMAGMDVRFDLPAGMIEDLEHRRVSGLCTWSS